MHKTRSGLNRAVKSYLKFFANPKVKKIVIIISASLVGVLLLVQLFYPRDRALLGTSLAAQEVSGWTSNDIKKLADELYEKSTIEVGGSGRVMLARSLSAVGVKINTSEVVEEVTNYPLWARFVPSSVFWYGHAHDEFAGSINSKTLDKFVAENEASFVTAAENARLAIDGSKVKIVKEVQGARLAADQFKSGVRRPSYKFGSSTALDVKFVFSDPAVLSSDLLAKQKIVQAMADKQISLKYQDKTVAAAPEAVASWLVIGQDDIKSADDISVDINQEAALQFVHTEFDKTVAKAPGTTEVFLTDGVEQTRKPGPDGQAVDDGRVAADIKAAIVDGGDTNVAVAAKVIPAKIKNNHTFTKSQRGLQAYLNSLADEGDIRVSVSQLGGSGWSASYRGGEQTTAASTYKLYVVAYALDQIAEGKLSYDDQVNGTSFRECMSRAIIKSDNACPEAMLAKFGRSTVNEFLYEKGYSRATTFSHSGATQTSANDLIKILTSIERGDLVKGAERDFMLGLMRVQVYRQGVPAGTSATVADKVGFLYGYLNDAAIVYHPSGTYVLSVMTDGLSWGKIAEITRKIEGIMY